MKKTIRTPIIGGLIFGALSYLTTMADLTIQVSQDLILGPWEIFNTLSAALFGPIGMLITELGLDISGYVYLIKGVYPAPQDAYFMIGNYIAHIVGLFFVAFGYRYLHQRTGIWGLLAGWVLVMGIYYIVGITLTVPLHNIAVPGLGASYTGYFSNVRVEFVLVCVITALILLALPEHYRRPRWHEPKPSTD